jgi:hypothetical protein
VVVLGTLGWFPAGDKLSHGGRHPYAEAGCRGHGKWWCCRLMLCGPSGGGLQGVGYGPVQCVVGDFFPARLGKVSSFQQYVDTVQLQDVEGTR